MNGLAPLLLGLIFLLSAGAIWLAGVKLSNTTAVLSTRLGMGEALGGLILLALATNLPEVAITASAALSHNLGIAIGNILGGIAIQTVVLVVLDAIGVKGDRPLTYRAASLQLVLEAALVIAVLMVAVAGTQLPKTLIFLRIEPAGLLIATLWIGGLLRVPGLSWPYPFLFLGLPGAVLAALLTAAAAGAGATRRRRDMALLRTRGATRKTMAGLAIVESLAVGIGGGGGRPVHRRPRRATRLWQRPVRDRRCCCRGLGRGCGSLRPGLRRRRRGRAGLARREGSHRVSGAPRGDSPWHPDVDPLRPRRLAPRRLGPGVLAQQPEQVRPGPGT